MDFQSTKSFGKLRLRAFQPYYQILYMLRLLTLGISISNAFNTIYVDTVNTKHIHTFLPITFLIFNGFSIRKKFWKAETQGFSTIPSILYVSLHLRVQNRRKKWNFLLNFCTMRKLSDLYSGIFQTQSSGCVSGLDHFRNFPNLKILNI